jgi:hypothetical protein
MSQPPSKPIQIDIAGQPVGVVVPTNGRFRFLAVRLSAFPLDGALFDSVSEARSAVGRVTAAEPQAAVA